ncbi:MAG TPA: Stf0 family sulfotransferase [Methylomirabilota bacterium]
MTRISLCIVARDEARFLPGCIASARAVVDEVIVVDTGSTDGTCAVAREAGARVFVAEWPGDLGAAHDLPVARASGDWILSLDADEVLEPASQAHVRRLVDANRGADGFRVSIRNYEYGIVEKMRPADPADPLTHGAAAYRPTTPVRLFRRRPGVGFAGRLHQSMAVAIERHGGRIADSPIVIHHYGHLRTDRAKTSFYRALARRQAAAEPTNPAAWLGLGAAFVDHEDLPAALDAFRRSRRLGRRPAAAYLIGATLLALGQPDASVRWLRQALRENDRDQSPYFDRADALELLGEAHETLERPRLAERAYRRALALRPESRAAANNLAGLLGERGRYREAEALLAALIRRHPGADGPRATLGALRLRRRDLDGARRSLETALEINAENASARVNLGLAHARAGHPRRAARAFAAAWDLRAGDVVHRLGFAPLLPPPPRRPALRPMAPGGVVSVIARLYGGSARVLVDYVQALPGRPHLVLCGDAGAFTRQGLRAELEASGAEVRTVASAADVRRALGVARPGFVIHHWWENDLLPAAVRVADERWIAVGHASLPMPRGYDAYAVLSDHHARFQAHLPAERQRRIPNGVSLARIPRPRSADRPVTIVMLSRLEPSKFTRRLLAFLPPLRDLGARLLIAGRGGRRFEIEQDLHRRRLGDSVRFVGALPSQRVPAFLAAADIGLHLTEMHEEICSMSILEMLAAGLPIVAEPKGCLPELVVTGRNGFLAEREDEIAGALTRLIQQPALRRRLGAASREAARRYSLDRFRASVAALISATGDRAQARAAAVARPTRVRRAERSVEAWKPDASILVCATPRSGGGAWCRALWRTGIAGRPRDFLDPRTVRAQLAFLNGAGFGGYLAQALEEGSSPNGVFSGRLLVSHAIALHRRLDAAAARRSAGAHDRLQRWFPGVRLVWVRRRNTLDQAAAWLRTECDSEDERLDRSAVNRRRRAIEAQEARWQRLFASWKAAPLVVWYEDLVREPGPALRALLTRLGIAVPRPTP